jgi:serine/threonine-protein kinase
LATTLIGGMLASVVMWQFKPSTTPTVTRFPITLGEGQKFTNVGRRLVDISPDGTQMVYSANNRLYHWAMAELEVRPIPGTETPMGVTSPVFSPDGRSVIFFSVSDSMLEKIAVAGGAAVPICATDNPMGVDWSADGIVYGQGSKGIMRVSEDGGNPEVLVSVKDGEVATNPQLLPGGQAVLFTLTTGAALATSATLEAWDKAQIVVQSLEGGKRTRLFEGGSDARYVPTGHIVYAVGGTLFAVPFDSRGLTVTGGKVPVVEGVRRSTRTGSAQYSFSDTGSLIYIPGSVAAAGDPLVLARRDRKGVPEPLKGTARAYGYPRVSPDGKSIAIGIEDATDVNIWIYDIAGRANIRKLTLGGANRYPIWSADSLRIAFQSDRDGGLAIWWQLADGSDTAVRLTKPEQGIAHIPDSWWPRKPPEIQKFSFTAIKGREAEVWIYSFQDPSLARFARMPSFFVGLSAFSPDGQWLAYQTSRNGRNQISVGQFPTGATYVVGAGAHPFWSQSNKTELELFYGTSPTDVSMVGIKTMPSFALGDSVPVPNSLGIVSNDVHFPRNMDISPDGKNFFVLVCADKPQTGACAAPQITVELNWFEDLKQRMSGR